MTRMRMDELMDLYERDPDYRMFVDKSRKNSGKTVEQMLSLHTVSDYGMWLKETKKGDGIWMD